MAIKAIIFDVYGVFLKAGKIYLRDIQKHNGKPVRYVERFGAELTKGNVEEFKKLLGFVKKGQMSEDEALEKFSKFTKLPAPRDPMTVWKATAKIIRIEKTFEIARRLKKNYKVAILSNIIPSHHKFRSPLFEEFKPFVHFSCLTGKAKPDEEAFHHILYELKVRPEEALFIDDLETNFNGAKAVGIKPILFKNPDQLEKDLKALGLQF